MGSSCCRRGGDTESATDPTSVPPPSTNELFGLWCLVRERRFHQFRPDVRPLDGPPVRPILLRLDVVVDGHQTEQLDGVVRAEVEVTLASDPPAIRRVAAV